MSRVLGVYNSAMPRASSSNAPHSPAAATNAWMARSLVSPRQKQQINSSQPNVQHIECFYDAHDALTPMPAWTKRDVELFGPLPPALTERERIIAARWLFDADTMEWTRPTPFHDPDGILLGRARELGLPVDGLEEDLKQHQSEQQQQHIQLRENQMQHHQQGQKRQREAEHDELPSSRQHPSSQQPAHSDEVPPSMRRAWEQYQLARAAQRTQAQDPNALQIKLIATPPPAGSPMMTTPQIKSASSPLNAGSPLISHPVHSTSSPLRRPAYATYQQRGPGGVQLPHPNHVSMTPQLGHIQPQPHHATQYDEQAMLSQQRMPTPSSSLDVKPVIPTAVVSSPSPATTLSSTISTPNMQAMGLKQEEAGMLPDEGPARKKQRMSELSSAALMATPTYVQQNAFLQMPEQVVYMHAQAQVQAHMAAYGGMSSVPMGYYLPS